MHDTGLHKSKLFCFDLKNIMKHIPNTIEKEEIVRSQNAIRKKFRRLKREDEANTQHRKRSFRPITDSIKTLIESNKKEDNIEKLLNSTAKTEDENDTEHDTTKYYDPELSEDETMNQEKQNERNETNVDPLLETFLSLHADKDSLPELDRSYGIRSNGRHWLLGNSQISVRNDKIIIKNKEFQGTQGLYELLFLKNPDENIYTADDLTTYKEMLLLTNAHKQRYAHGKQVNSNKGQKYKKIIMKLFKKKTRGSGVHLNSVRYEHWDDPNELVERLRLLIASEQAGNTSVGNEIISIIEELREAKIIE